jgi:hypothetical protein
MWRITKGRIATAYSECLLGLQRSVLTAWTRESRNMENLKKYKKQTINTCP